MVMRVTLIGTICLLTAVGWAVADDNSYQHFGELFMGAMQAEQAGEYEEALDLMSRSLEMIPHHPYLHYRLAGLQALMGETEEAVASLKHAIVLGLDFGEQLPANLEPLQEDPGFANVQHLIEAMRKPVATSEVALTLPKRDMIPEGLAYDPDDDRFYMGGIWSCNIIRFDRQGDITDFTTNKQDGLRSVLGLRIDATRRVLWAASEVSGARPDIAESEMGWSDLFKYDLRSGKLLAKYSMHEEGVAHLFNDIAVTANGDAYVTDSEFGAIYVVRQGSEKLELFLRSETFFSPNGITIGGDDNTLYMAAEENGVFRIDIASKAFKLLPVPSAATHIGVDGIYYHENSLVCVQNGLGRISRLHLDETSDRIVKVDVIETRNPHFDIPTTGAIVGGTFFYIANSQMRAFDAEGKVLPADQLKETVILSTDLD